MMCKDNKRYHPTKELVQHPLTIGKVYNSIDFPENMFDVISVWDDEGILRWYESDMFIPLEEYRANQIEKII